MEATTTEPVSLRLPWPPSMNSYWRHVLIRRRAVTLLSREGRAFRAAVCDELRNALVEPMASRLAVTIVAHPPDRRVRDLDNLLKPTLDALVHAEVIADDGLIDELTISRGTLDPGTGHLEVRIRNKENRTDAAQ